ncbi:MAG: glycosyltransferase family 39 protein [Rhizomicrobium sp.]
MQLRGDNILADTWSGPFAGERSGTVAFKPAVGREISARRGALRILARRAGSTRDLAFLAIAVLICLRIVLAAVLPLSFDEAYYWLWSKHLAAGYLEHPAAIAVAIRAGTFLFGDTEFGVRAIPLLASVLASWAVWRSAAIILSDGSAGAIASLLFNATLMVAAEGLAATPDSLLVAAAAMLVWAIAELERTQNGRWWFAVGAAAGVAIAAKYTGIFLCAAVAVSLVAGAFRRQAHPGRAWLKTIWPFAGAAVALALFAPTLYWNALHGFISFRFQAGRVLIDHPGARYLLEFLGSQMALASPGVILLAGMSSCRILRHRDAHPCMGLVSLVVWLPLGFFLLHSLHDRVQGNWPSFVYPALAILAAKSFREIPHAAAPSRTARLVRISAIPLCGVILAVAYAQAFFGVFPMGRSDPIARMTAVGFQPVARRIADYAEKTRARAIVTTNYPTTSWLRFYERPRLPIIQIADANRFLSSPRATRDAFGGNLLYVTRHPRRDLPAVLAHFSTAALLGVVVRLRQGQPIDKFAIFTIGGLRGPPPGRVP